MSSIQAKSQKKFRAKRIAEGGMRLDMWLSSDEATKLNQLSKWRGQTRPQVILSSIQEMWEKQIPIAAEAEHADALLERGRQYVRGNDEDEAEQLFRKSAEKGVAAAQNNLGVILWNKKEYEEAALKIKESASKNLAVSQYNLGILYVHGHGMKQDFKRAAMWFEQSSEQNFIPAHSYLGLFCALGKGIKKDEEKAIELIKKATGKTTTQCQLWLANLLATDPKNEIRDGLQAIIISKRLIKRKSSSVYLNALAAGYAERNRFEEALRTQRKAIVKLQENKPKDYKEDLKEYEKRLENYLRAKPWRNNVHFAEGLFFA